ncbi:hypothetical protein GGF37_000091 [Kickxella alabastrina]|nr:hypothetical protein GGF37_000091 [Kickxella alabastrina]
MNNINTAIQTDVVAHMHGAKFKPSASEPLSHKPTNGRLNRFASTQLAPLDISKASYAHNCPKVDLLTPDEAHPSSIAQFPLHSPVNANHPNYPAPSSPTYLNTSITFCPSILTPDILEDEDGDVFTPYIMDRIEPKARELQRSSRFSLLRRQRNSPKMVSSSVTPDGMVTPGSTSASSSSSESGHKQEAGSTLRLKRSLSALLHRSTSMIRRSESNIFRKNHTGGSANDSWEQAHTDEEKSQCNQGLSSHMSLSSTVSTPEFSTEKKRFACAFSVSHFNVAISNTMVSPLIGKSMIHIKVIMDAETIIVMSMVRTIVFALARERILTKLFQGGVPFVVTKRRKLILRNPDCGKCVAVVGDNQTWRNVLDTAGYSSWLCGDGTAASTPRLNEMSDGGDAIVGSGVKTVMKLTLHLVDPSEVPVA